MKLSAITAHIRLRSPWEAMDLGFSMVQHYWRNIFPIWAILLFSISAAVWLALPPAYSSWASLVVWWLKPLYDRLLLHCYSQQLFNQPVNSADLLQALPRLILHTGLGSALSWRRFSLSRGFNLPIWQLEQLRGQKRRERQSLLHLQAHSYAVWLLVVSLHLEWILLLSACLLILIVDPTNYTVNYIKALFTNYVYVTPEAYYWFNLIYLILYTITVLIIEPFYMAASFSLYLNRRTQLEAWDIELAFRHLAQRLKNSTPSLAVTAACLIALGFTFTTSFPVYADNSTEILASERLPPSQAHHTIEEIMQLEEFSKTQKVERWLPKNKSPETNKTDQNGQTPASSIQIIVGTIIKGFLWLALIVFTVVLFIYRKQLLAMLKPRRLRTATVNMPDVLLGMDIRPESLPNDIAQSSLQLWQQGKPREALSLLYRGALMRLTRYDQLDLHSSHTEGDILQLAQQRALALPRLAWLTATTQVWQEIAYAHRIPPDTTVLPLFANWTQFATTSEVGA